jgi:hypothetical protein
VLCSYVKHNKLFKLYYQSADIDMFAYIYVYTYIPDVYIYCIYLYVHIDMFVDMFILFVCNPAIAEYFFLKIHFEITVCSILLSMEINLYSELRKLANTVH